MLDYRLGRCDGRHEMIDFRLVNNDALKRSRHAAIAFSYRPMLQRAFPAGFIAPCLPTKIDKLPSFFEWRPARTTEDRTCLRP